MAWRGVVPDNSSSDMLKSILLLMHLAATIAGNAPMRSRPCLPPKGHSNNCQPTPPQQCNSPVFCKTKKVTYMSMSEMPQAFLNVSTMAFKKTTDIASCQRLCLNQAGCFSLNINIATAKNYVCNMLTGNIYSNASRLVKNTDFVHLFIQSPCKKKPCKNDAVCIPNYKYNTYSCSCKFNSTFKTKGKNCETIARGLKSADYYYNFDKKFSGYFKVMVVGEPHEYSQLKSNTKVMNVPERPSPVTYISSSRPQPMYTESTTTWACLNYFTYCRAFSYNLWVRFTEKEASQDKTHQILFTVGAAGSAIGVSFRANGKKGDNFQYDFSLRTSTAQYYTLYGFGKDTQPDKWNNFIITFTEKGGPCAYINGKRAACNPTATSKVISSSAANAFQIGYSGASSKPTEMFVDDFAIWKASLSAEMVEEVYRDGTP